MYLDALFFFGSQKIVSLENKYMEFGEKTRSTGSLEGLEEAKKGFPFSLVRKSERTMKNRNKL